MGDIGDPPRRRVRRTRSPTSRPSTASWTTGRCSTNYPLRSEPRGRRRRRRARRDRVRVADEAQGRHRHDDRQHGDVPRRRRQDHRGLELRLQARGLAVTERVLDELGYYLLAGAGGEGPSTLMDEARRGEEMGFGTAFISERWNVKEASSLVGAALRGHRPHADRHRRNQSQHPTSIDHRFVGDHHAPVVGWAVHARHRPGRGRDVRRVRRARR